MNTRAPTSTPSAPIAERREAKLTPIVERRQPRWIERMQRQGLPPKDLIGQVKVA